MKMKMLKRIVIALIITLLLSVPVIGHADVGGFSGDFDYGGGWDSGSDWGSSDWDSGWDSDYDWDDDDDWSSDSSGSSVYIPVDTDLDLGGGTPIGGCCFVVIVVVIIIIIVSRKNKGGGSRPGGSSGTRNPVMPQGAKPTNKETVDPIALKQKDPNFSEQEILEKVSNQYVQMQNCWQDKNWEPMRAIMTDALWSQLNRQLEALKRNGQTNYVERIAVLGTRIVGYYADKVNDNLVIELRTRITDYTVNDATGAVVSGSKTAEKFMTYEWTLVRSLEKATGDKEDMSDPHCPNCGAPIAINHSAKCEYCGQVLTADDYDWTISAIRGISQVTRGN